MLLRDLDARAAAAASARPHLQLPARIGLARIERGEITPIPPSEWATWRALRERLGPEIAEIAPVSALVSQSITQDTLSRTPHDAITQVRLGAARQRLDAVLLYEVAIDTELKHTELTFLDATIVGLWVFPTHRSHATAHAAATLIDVSSGFAYGSSVGSAEDARKAAFLGSDERRLRQRDDVARKAVDALALDVAAMIQHLATAGPGPTAAERRVGIPDQDTAPTHAAVGDRVIEPAPPGTGDSFWGRN